MKINALDQLEKIKTSLIEAHGLTEKITTRNNIIYRNNEIALIENLPTGDLKIKRNLW
jgi:hypothetical protein